MFCECGCGQITTIIKKTQKDRGRVIGKYSRFIMGHKHFKKGCSPWNKGKTDIYSEETIKKMSGENHPNYIDGRSIKEKYCKDCSKPIFYTATYCTKCSKIGKRNYFYGKHPFGNKNSNWKGGISFEPYTSDFNQQLKDKIRVRDSFVCQLCGVPELECNNRLDIHHIDYDKKNCEANNLLSLCRSCNAKVNFNREYWTNYFQSKLKECHCG